MQNIYKNYIKVFMISFIAMMIIMTPVMIMNHGYFIYMGDYNYQHIVFNAHCYQLIRDGFSMWDSVTGLGTDSLSAFSHIIMTPFFVLLLLMPDIKAAVLFLPVLNALKTATAAVTAYAYIRRYTRENQSAFIGAVLYAFSGFQMFSFIFGSFHDVTAWFPLMLLCMDEYMTNEKKGLFAIIVAFMAALNAFFFYGQVVFVVIYFIVKCVTKEYKFTLKKFLGLFIESVAGVLTAGILLYPGVMSLASNSRVGEFICGLDTLTYSDRSIPLRIFQSIFMMPDKASETSLFAGDRDTTWSSLSLYLPVAGIVFVYGYIKRNIKNSFSLLLVISVIFAFCPVLNSTFFMFNQEYYARWFYMPLLIMATVTSVETESDDNSFAVSGIKFSAVCMLILALVACLPDKVSEKTDPFSLDSDIIEKIKPFSLPEDPIYFWRMLGLAGFGVLVIYLILTRYSKNKTKRIFISCLSGIAVLNIIYINDVRGYDASVTDYDVSFLQTPELPDTEDEFYRTYGYNYNANVLWNKPGLDDFITSKPASVMDFYSELGMNGVQIEYIDYRYFPVYGLLSVKYYLNPSTKDELNVEYNRMKIPGFNESDVQPCYHIYENQAFIPVGFTYDNSISASRINEFTEEYGKAHPTEKEETDENDIFFRFNHSGEFGYEEKYLQKMLVMMRALVLSDEDAEKYKDILPAISDEDMSGLGEETYYSDSSDRAVSACSEFKFDGSSFTARIDSDRENLVFFSVPYTEGWRAQVNGKDAEIIKANYGFMAVKVEAGENDIVFNYTNDTYRTGAVISAAGLMVYAAYMAVNIISGRKRKKAGAAA